MSNLTPLTLLPLDKTALNYKDLSDHEKRKERNLRILLVVSGLILLAGMSVAIYFCCTRTLLNHRFNPITERYEEERISADIASILPAIFVGVPALALLFCASFSLEWRHHRHREREDKQAEVLTYIQELARFQNIFNYYCHGGNCNGCFTPFVRKGILSPEEAQLIKRNLIDYAERKKSIKELKAGPRVRRINITQATNCDIFKLKDQNSLIESGWVELRDSLEISKRNPQIFV